VVEAARLPGALTEGLSPFRLLTSDAVVVTMAEEPVLSTETISALASQLSEFARDVPIVRTVFRPAPLGGVSGRKIFFATTASERVAAVLRRHLEEVHGATVVDHVVERAAR
jgi:predicted GTPase